MKRNWFFLVLPLFVAGCLHSVNYKLAESDRWRGTKINGVVCVQPIVDLTVFDLANWQLEHSGNQIWRDNYRAGYNHTNLSAEVTVMIAKHLAYSRLFTKVVSRPDTKADYVLSGALTDFQARGRVNREAENIETGAMLLHPLIGLFGTVGTAGMKTEIKTAVKLADLKLADKSQQVLWQDSIYVSTNVTANFRQSGSGYLFEYPDRSLKAAVNEMIQRLGTCSLTNR